MLLYFQHLPVIQCSTIVRCHACRTYINPFVYFNDSKRWKCNLCYRINECKYNFFIFSICIYIYIYIYIYLLLYYLLLLYIFN